MSSLDVSKEKSSIQSEYVRRGQRKAAASSHYARRPFRAKSHPDTEKDSLLSVCSRPFTRRSRRLDTALKLQHPSIRSTRSTFQQRAGASSRADHSFRIKPRPDTEKDSILSVCSRPFARRSRRLDTALKLQHPSIRSTRSTFQQRAGASFRADRPCRAKSRPDTEKDSEYTSMFVRKKRPLRAAFASPRRSAGNSSFFNRKRIIRLSPRWPPELPSRVRVGQRTPQRKRGVRVSSAQRQKFSVL